MAKFGVVDQTSTIWSGYSSNNGAGYIVGGNFPGGTITALKFFAKNVSNTPSFNSFDLTIYSGGDASGPSGATKLWQSRDYYNVNLGNTLAWQSAVDGGGSPPSVSASAGYIWIVYRSYDGFERGVCSVGNAGDFATYGEKQRTGMGSVGTSMPSTFPGNHNSYTGAEPAMFFLEYSASVGVSVDDAEDELFENGESITITGSGFGDSQGGGSVVISPTDDIDDAGAVVQTVSSWAAGSITIEAVRDDLDYLTNAYLFVENTLGESNASGLVVQFEPKVYIRHRLISPADGTPVTSLSGAVMHVWRTASPSGAPDETLSGVSTDGSGYLAQKITRGSLVSPNKVWVMIAKSGSPGSGGVLNLLPSYED